MRRLFHAPWTPVTLVNSSESFSDGVTTAAASWLARRDRGLSPAEQDAYLQWLREHPSHGVAVSRLEKAWVALDPLREWRPANSPQPNPDLLAPRRRRFRHWQYFATAIAAVVVVALVVWPERSVPPTSRHAVIHPGPERIALPDGSVIILNSGAKVETSFTPTERRVHLVEGEAHFSVAKDAARPFIVRADKISVRAVGTAFTVNLKSEAVSVLVTEGTVRLGQNSAADQNASVPIDDLSHVVAGQQAIVTTPPNAAVTWEVHEFTPAQVDVALSWQGLRLEFVEMPLADVVAEFNRYNVRKLVIDTPATGAILVGGNFRADNVDSFVRLLDLGFGVTAQPRGNEIVLRRRE